MEAGRRFADFFDEILDFRFVDHAVGIFVGSFKRIFDFLAIESVVFVDESRTFVFYEFEFGLRYRLEFFHRQISVLILVRRLESRLALVGNRFGELGKTELAIGHRRG